MAKKKEGIDPKVKAIYDAYCAAGVASTAAAILTAAQILKGMDGAIVAAISDIYIPGPESSDD